MFDVFYSGTKPNLFAHEREATDLEHAQQLSRTRYFWWINHLTDYSGFDFLWEPVPWEAHQRHAWPSQHQPDSQTYLVPKTGYTDTNYRSDTILPRQGIEAQYWTQPDGIENFDYTWHPNPTEPKMIYQFGTQHQRTGGPRYCVPGAMDVKYVDLPRAIKTTHDSHWSDTENTDASSFDWTWHPDDTEPPFIYQFGTQWQKTGGPRYSVPGAVDVKYVALPRATKTTQDSHWTVPEGADVSSFDWTWHPDATEQPYIYQFGTQHQKTGGPQYCVPGATDIKFVDQIRIKTNRVASAIYEIDHMDGNAGQIPNTARRVRYFDNYRDTLIRIAKSIGDEHEFVWICSSICDYSAFDFSWHPEQWQASMLHVFASNGEKFGDTFFMHVPTFAARAERVALLEWYDVNFIETSVPRRSMPVIQHNYDSQAQAVAALNWEGPLALLTNNDRPNALPTVPLWRQETKTIVPLSVGASAVIVPKTAKGIVRTQLYDYPYIDKTQSRRHSDQPLDIVFIENGENEAQQLFGHLFNLTMNKPNSLHKVSGVKGRVAAYHAAAEKSTTPWFFAVFAKLQVDNAFPWDWQPDRMQQAKHYIFHARNPINNLVYGHQAMIAYNRKLVLENTGVGLDFTLDQAHEVVPILSGTANYYTDNWMCWRTAFREVLKLRASLPDVENEYRLDQWLTVDTGAGQWSSKGAQDAVEYYDAVGGDPAELRKSYEWDWLASYAFVKRGLVSN